MDASTSAPVLPDPKHEAFAQSIALGTDPAEACRKIFRCKSTTAAQTKSADLLADPAITSRIADLQDQAAHIAEHQASFTKADLITFLVETIQSPVSSIDQHHRQCQEWTRDELTASGRRANPATQQKTPSEYSKPTAKGKATSHSQKAAPAKPTSSASSASSTESSTPDLQVTTPILLRSKTKLPSKLDAAKLLATLCGWHAPAKLEGHVHHLIDPTVQEALSRLLR